MCLCKHTATDAQVPLSSVSTRLPTKGFHYDRFGCSYCIFTPNCRQIYVCYRCVGPDADMEVRVYKQTFDFSPLSYYYIKRVRAKHGKRSVLSDSTGE